VLPVMAPGRASGCIVRAQARAGRFEWAAFGREQ